MKPIAMLLALLLSACPVTVIDAPPACAPCRMKCDQDLGDSCDDCRSEKCPNMDDADD